ncbi:Nramp family divalent metal transporter [Echinicola marina]|uniref:Nramp family divalent metal transporter n=1 Tax=Echinicola marina TaxID=2859768 RepID=UPI001CF67899|nr:Nramp family divalent metal transporter [Echinicola marina]UCS92926.1 Nramp family divalent metal transporter [Echinicola marina]
MKRNLQKFIGPGTLVMAAFIGPGTVTVCTLAGVKFGYELIWALLLSILATILLQEMSARIGLINQKGLIEIVRQELKHKWPKIAALSLIIIAIVVGNAAYEAGNISGAVLGLNGFKKLPFFNTYSPYPIIVGLLAWSLLMSGSYKKVASFMLVIVLTMSAVFLLTAIMGAPQLRLVLGGLVPSINTNNIITIGALIGTTVVPYNLFLHAALVTKKWQGSKDLKYAQLDTIISVSLGGLVSIAILITGSLGSAEKIDSVLDLAESLVPLFGKAAPYFLGVGLFAAGITSSITAPLAAGLVICGCFGWNNALNSKPMRWTFSLIILLGVIFASLGIKPIELITVAQLTNGILLPVLSTFILWVANNRKLMNKYKNGVVLNILGFGIWIITWIIGIKSITSVLEKWQVWG